MRKLVLISICFCFVCLSVGQAGGPVVVVSGNELSVHAQKIPLQNILREIARQGIIVRIDPDINPEISARFDNREISAALKTILKSTSHILIWERVKGAPGSKPAVIEIQVFNPGEKERMKALEARSVFAVARRGAKGPFYKKGVNLVPGYGDSDF